MASRVELRAWLADSLAHLRPAIEACATGALPPNMAVLRLAMEAQAPDEIEAALAQASDGARDDPRGRHAAKHLHDALSLWRANPQAFETVKSVLDGVDHSGVAKCVNAGVAQWADAFDRMAKVSPEGSVALYALGNPDLLREATKDVVARMRDWGLLDRTKQALEIGCGIGRFVAALAPEFEHVTGLDISETMIAKARERCAGQENVTLARSSGQDLADIKDRSVDLVLASDVFPYIVAGGRELVDAMFAEIARVLRPQGHLLILNFSYRGDLKRDRSEVLVLGVRRGFSLRRSASGDFAFWDGATFLLQRT